MDLVDWTLRQFLLFVLLLFRMAGLFVIAPLFRSAGIPPQALIGLAALTAVLVMPAVARMDPALPTELGGYTVAALAEGVVGYLIGFSAELVFSGAQLAGLYVGQQMGLTIASVIDPISNEQQSVLGQFKFLFAMLIFLTVNGHHLLIAVVVDSFRVVPPLGCRFGEALGRHVAYQQFTEMMEASVRLSAPALVALLMATVAMALLARTVPEVNIFIIGFGLRVLIGIVFVMLSLPLLGRLLRASFDLLETDLRQVVRLMG
ncbi:MAG: flagellar biosynthetic protein FliR [Planctomycetes bacterium]|nr:flagellar biosynthetic protein FliR [Planctomycetota bacterium]